MSEPFLAEVRIVGFNFARGVGAFCDGQILPINQNQSLYSLLGTIYGGDGRTSFALPDLRGRTPVHVDHTYSQGSKGGAETVALTVNEIPSHTHTVGGSTAADTDEPGGNYPGKTEDATYHTGTGATTVDLAAGTVAASPSQAHDNMQPFLALNFCIALQGLFPSRN